MSLINAYGDPTITVWEVDDNGEKISIPIQNEKKQVNGNRIILEGLPDEQYRVFIDGFVEVGIRDEITEPNQFKVDYRRNGIVFVHESLNGQWLTVGRYYSRGVYYLPASRIWTKLGDAGEVLETLEDALVVIENISGDIGEIIEIIENATNIKNELQQAIDDGNLVSSVLINNISSASDVIDEISDSIVDGDNLIADINTAIGNANSAKTSLDTVVANAQSIKTELSSIVGEANLLDTSLSDLITTGTTLNNNLSDNISTGNTLLGELQTAIINAGTAKSELNTSIGNANTSKTNLDGSISNANTVKGKLDENIDTAQDLKLGLDGSISQGELLNTDLVDNISTATTKNTDLKNTITNSNTAKTNLDEIISIANATNANLDNSIVEGDNLKDELAGIIAGTDFEQVIEDISHLKKDQHNHDNKLVLDKLSEDSGKLKFSGQDVGVGDMTKTVYDTNNNGKVDTAENAEKLGGKAPSHYALKNDIPTIPPIPSKTSDLDNDSGFITSDDIPPLPDNLATKEELNSGLADKVDNSRVLTDVPANAKFTDTITTINNKTGTITKDDIVALGIPSQDSVDELKFSELSSTATNIDSEGIYKNVEYKRKDNTLYAKSTLSGTSPNYNQIKIEYYNDTGTSIIKTITWSISYDVNDFPYVRTVV